MATTITIAIGATTPISKIFDITNTKAKNTIIAFADALNLTAPDATDQQKAEAAIVWWVKVMRDHAFAKYQYDKRTTTDQEASALYGFD